VRYLSDTPDEISPTWSVKPGGKPGFGSMVLGVEFYHVIPGARSSTRLVTYHSDGELPTFWVIICHFPIAESVKDKCAVVLRRLLDELSFGRTKPILLMGDFNTFKYPDSNGEMPRAESQWSTVLGKDLKDGTTEIIDRDGVARCGTYYGYEAKSEGMTHLDHIAHTAHFHPLSPCMAHITSKQLDERNGPSDHVAISLQMILKIAK